MTAFDRIRRIVLADPFLMDRLIATKTDDELFDAVVALGKNNGIEVPAAELRQLVNVNRRIWLERWIAL